MDRRIWLFVDHTHTYTHICAKLANKFGLVQANEVVNALLRNRATKQSKNTSFLATDRAL